MVNLRETKRTSKLKLNFPKINVIVLVYDEKVPGHRRIAISNNGIT